MGWMIVGWLSYMLSTSDHRLSFVEAWAAKHVQTLNGVLPGVVAAADFTDDRLGEALRMISLDEVWEEVERALSHQVVRVYELPQETVRADTTTVSLYHDSETSALYAYGHSKDHRPDLAQIKVLYATLDPLALPVTTLVVAGNQADAGLYIPAMERVQQNLPGQGLLYVGDSKMEAFATRAHLAASGHYYLMPLSQKGEQGPLLKESMTQVLEQGTALESVYALDEEEEGQGKLLAQGWETRRQLSDRAADTQRQWRERLLLIYSPTLAERGHRGLEKRLQTATKKLRRLTPAPGRGKRQYQELAPLQGEVDTILRQHRVADLLHVTYQEHIQERHIRRYKDQPARSETSVRYQIRITRNEAAIHEALRQMGWRLYATNAPEDRLTLAQAVRTYRGGVATMERLFARLKGRPLGLRPVFVRRDDHLVGLVRILSLALRILTLIEFVARRRLQTEQDVLPGLYPGNPIRPTNRPTSERLLRAFQGISLSDIDLPGQHIRHVTPLSPLQNRILQLFKFSDAIYTELALVPPIPP